MINQYRTQAMLNDLKVNKLGLFVYPGTPTDGSSGTGARIAGPGAIIIDTTNKYLYINTNTLASPTWTFLGGVNGLSGDITVGATGIATISPTLVKLTTGTILTAAITGTSAGQLGHAQGVVLVAAVSAHVVNQLVSAVLINDFGVAAYTGGGNTTINISGGGAALTGLVSNANFIQAAADKVIEFVPLAATFNTYTENNGIALVTASAPTNPGTAAGVFRYAVYTRQIATGL